MLQFTKHTRATRTRQTLDRTRWKIKWLIIRDYDAAPLLCWLDWCFIEMPIVTVEAICFALCLTLSEVPHITLLLLLLWGWMNDECRKLFSVRFINVLSIMPTYVMYRCFLLVTNFWSFGLMWYGTIRFQQSIVICAWWCVWCIVCWIYFSIQNGSFRCQLIINVLVIVIDVIWWMSRRWCSSYASTQCSISNSAIICSNLLLIY